MKTFILRKIQISINVLKVLYDLRLMTIDGFLRFTAASILLIGVLLAILTIEIL